MYMLTSKVKKRCRDGCVHQLCFHPFREKGAKIDVGNPMKRAHAKLLSRRYTTVSMLLLPVSTPHIVGGGCSLGPCRSGLTT
jgi:hypothetical protein